MNHKLAATASFTCFGWARFTEAGYFGMEKEGLRCGEGVR